jgi:hypothetical protein
VFLLAALLGAGCAGKAEVRLRKDSLGDELAGVAEDALAVSLRVLWRGPQGERPILEGQTLHNGDSIALRVRASQPAYLYIVHFAPDGSAETLFPTAEYDQLPPRCPLRLPLRGSLILQDPVGLEDLRVVASRRPLALADDRLCEELRLPCTPPPAAAPPRVAPCQEMPPARQTLVAQRAIFPEVKVGSDQGQGVASVRFSFRHAGKQP